MTRRLLLILAAGAAMVSVAVPAVAQTTSGSEVEIVDVATNRYLEGGRVQMLVELRNFDEIDVGALIVLENDRPVETLEVDTIDETQVPVGVVLAIDVSGSMIGEPLAQAKAAARAFVEQKREQDAIAIVSFADTVEVRAGFTTSRQTLLARIDELEAEGETSLYDAIVVSSELFQGPNAELQPNLIILSDGDDNGSEASFEEALAATEERRVRVFAVALESPEFNPEPLETIVEARNGLYLATTDPSELRSLYDDIQRELSNTLVVRFAATQTDPGPLRLSVDYEGLTDEVTVEVPGFVPTTAASATSTTTTLPAPQGVVVTRPAAFDRTLLPLVVAVSMGLAFLLFAVILFGPNPEHRATVLRRRLEAFERGRADLREMPGTTGARARLPFLKGLTERAERILRRRASLVGVNAMLEQGNIPLAPGEALAAAGGLALLGGILAGVLTRSVLMAGLVFAALALGAAALVQAASRRELRRFDDQLPDTLMLMATSLRAGYSLSQSLEAVVAEAPDPTAREFNRAVTETRLGLPVVEALEGVATRMHSADFSWAVMAIDIQREVGGNLAEVLQIVADTMLQRTRLRGEIKALTAEGRISAVVLIAMPFVLFGVLLFINADYLEPLLTRTIGILGLVGSLVLMAIGGIWLRRIVDIEP